MRSTYLTCLLIAAFPLSACDCGDDGGGLDGATDGGTSDSGNGSRDAAVTDLGLFDATSTDAQFDAGTVDTGPADSGGPDAGNTALRSECTALVHGICDYVQRCSSIHRSDEAYYCHPAGQTDFCDTLVGRVDDGVQAVVPGAIASCLALLSTSSCSFPYYGNESLDSDLWLDDVPCAPVTEGASGLGGSCYVNEDCAVGRCDVSSACPGTCIAKSTVGEPCERESDCAAGTNCNLQSETCATRGALDDECPAPQRLVCQDGLYCTNDITSRCRARAGSGEPCSAFDRDTHGDFGCIDGHWCDTQGGVNGTCQPFGGEGSRCTNFVIGPSCAPDLACINGVCAVGGQAGELCDEDTPCAVNHRCNSAGRCVLLVGRDGVCTETSACPLGYYCEGGACLPRPMAGETCGTQAACAQGVCVGGFCSLLTSGETCWPTDAVFDVCDQGYCNGQAQCSEQFVPIGQSCDNSVPCGPEPSVCAGGVCEAVCVR